jgi:hypothetical protein
LWHKRCATSTATLAMHSLASISLIKLQQRPSGRCHMSISRCSKTQQCNSRFNCFQLLGPHNYR